MKSKNELNNLYAQKCQVLGDLMVTREKLDARVAEVKAEIEVLNKMSPMLEQLEELIRKDEREQASGAKEGDNV